MIKQKLIPILLVLMLSFILVFASCNPTTDGDGGDGGAGDGGAGDGGDDGDGGSGDSGDGGSGDSGDGGSGDSGDGGSGDSGDGGSGDSGDGGSGDSGDGGSGDDGAGATMEKAVELTLNNWADDNFEGTERWFYFNTTVDKAYVVHTVDNSNSHADDPNQGAALEFDNKVGLYKEDGSSYEYYFPTAEGFTNGQIDVGTDKDKIICVAEEDKIYVKVTPCTEFSTPGVYYLKYNDCQELTITLEKGAAVPADVTLSEIGSIEPSAGKHWVEKDSDAEITVTPEEGYYLSEWKNDANGQTDTSISIRMDADKTVGAVINKLVDQFILTTEVVGEGSIEIKEPEEIPVGGVYATNTDVKLEATPANDEWLFVKWTIDGGGETPTEFTTNPMIVKMDKSKKVTALFTLKYQELTVGEWKAGNLNGFEEQWLYFTAKVGTVYELYTHDENYYHPDNPSGDTKPTFDNKVGVYKDSSESPASYTYTNMASGYDKDQVDLTTKYTPVRACLEFTAEGTKVWVKVKDYYSNNGAYWVKVIEKDTTPVSLSLAVEGKDDADSFEVSLNYVALDPADSSASPLVYENINTGRSVLIKITPGSGRKVEVTGADADKVVKRPDSSDIGILMDANRAITIAFSAE